MSDFSSPYNTSTPPLPPKPTGHSSGVSTPPGGSAPKPPPPLPPGVIPTGSYEARNTEISANLVRSTENIRGPDDGWLPDMLKDKSTADLHNILKNTELQQALVHSPATAHPSIPTSCQNLQSLLDSNISLATNLTNLEQRIHTMRQQIQSRLLALRALERQWQAKQAEQDEALRDFSASALYQKLIAAVGEQEMLCRAMEESFLDEDGIAGEREVAEYLRRLKDTGKLAYLRREQKERWDEGRIGGWRG